MRAVSRAVLLVSALYAASPIAAEAQPLTVRDADVQDILTALIGSACSLPLCGQSRCRDSRHSAAGHAGRYVQSRNRPDRTDGNPS